MKLFTYIIFNANDINTYTNPLTRYIEICDMYIYSWGGHLKTWERSTTRDVFISIEEELLTPPSPMISFTLKFLCINSLSLLWWCLLHDLFIILLYIHIHFFICVYSSWDNSIIIHVCYIFVELYLVHHNIIF